ncbi:MAG: Fe-S protein assembly chaperone HscA [Myxococcales bacterium]|nr:Fe-S protein assembly chaperone HscA [Myxococcales bacterium]
MALLQIFDPKAKPAPIGIDLGTTHSLVARVVDNRPECLITCDGSPLLPSVVHYMEHGGVLVGSEALRKAALFPKETLISVKRFMGRGADDAETRRLGPYTFVGAEGASNTVRFQVHQRAVTPVEVSAEILRALKTRAEETMRTVGGAVITVPAYFDDAQRQATRDAGRLAGLEVLRLLNEPTAAALAYGLDKGRTKGTFAVYDFGGGTFDITVLVLDDGVFEVRATGGDAQLGGDDIDRALAGTFLSEMNAAEAPSAELIRVALLAARAAKHALTDAEETEVSIAREGGEVWRTTLTRARFEALVAPVVERTGPVVRRALRDAGLKAEALDGVILVGGSTRVPLVRRFVETLFQQTPLADIDPDQVVALGAAIQANLLAGDHDGEEALILDVTPLSLGLETMGGIAEKILPRNTTIPAGRAQVFTTYADNQTGFVVHVVQGERELAADNRSLARFTLKGIPPMPAGAARLEVTFRVDADGLLTVRAHEQTTGVEQSIEVTPSYGLHADDIEKMLLDSFEHAEDDLQVRQLQERIVEAEQVIAATEKALTRDGDLLDEDERAELDGALGALRGAIAQRNKELLKLRTEGLDRASLPLAERRMNRAVRDAMKGHALQEFEEQVKDRPLHPHLVAAPTPDDA